VLYKPIATTYYLLIRVIIKYSLYTYLLKLLLLPTVYLIRVFIKYNLYAYLVRLLLLLTTYLIRVFIKYVLYVLCIDPYYY